MKYLSYPRAFLLFVIIPAVTMGCSAAGVLAAPMGFEKTGDKIIRFWSKWLLRLSSVQLQVKGLEHLQGLGSVIFVSNHSSHFDIPVLFQALPCSFRMVAKEELFRIPLFGRALKALGFISIARDNPETQRETFTEAKQKMNRGESLWIAPEGTRFAGEGVGAFKSGAFYLAMKTGDPLVPICIFGTSRVLPKGGFFINWGRPSTIVHVHILKPPQIKPRQEGGAEKFASLRHELRDSVRALIVDEFEKLRLASDGPGPLKEAAEY